jgi:hypothetical protein
MESRLGTNYNAATGTGDHTVIFRFSAPISGGNATIIGGSGTISGQTLNGSDLVVNLTGVANAQMLSFNLTDVVDQLGNAVAAEQTQIGFLVGDVNGNGTVNSSDIGQVKAQAGSAIDANFRFDLNGNGAINATDVSIVKANAGATIP